MNEPSHDMTLFPEQVVNVQITDFNDAAFEGWDLRCEVREQMRAFLQSAFPQSLPRQRVELVGIEHQDSRRDDPEWSTPRSASRQNGG